MRAAPRGPEKMEPRKKRRFPWLPLLLLLGTIYLFWVLPEQLRPRPVEVEFGQKER